MDKKDSDSSKGILIEEYDPGLPLYKYRSLYDLKRFIDIFINRRLYAAKYLELNDPMEGQFRFDINLPSNIRHEISLERASKRICSFSKDGNNGLMWSLYADSHKGCVIKLKVTSKSGKLYEVRYTQTLPFISKVTDTVNIVDSILTTKSQPWEHEKEIRWIGLNPQSSFVKIKIEEVNFGIKVSKSDFSFYKKLINSIDPRIVVKKETFSKNTINFGFTL